MTVCYKPIVQEALEVLSGLGDLSEWGKPMTDEIPEVTCETCLEEMRHA